MDIEAIITLIERVGFIGAMLIVGAFLFWQSQKQSSKRDASNAVLHKGHLDIQLQQTVILSRLTGNVEDNQHSIKEQSDKINGKLDSLPHQITQATDNATTTITQRMDTQHEAVLKVIGGIKDPITAINSMFQELKKTQEQAHAISLRIESALPTVTADITRIIREETKANDLQKIPVINVNHNGADG